MPINKILIANRGEIAIRIVRAARELGIGSVAIHSADDATSLHVRRADESHALEGVGSRAYLDIDGVIEAAQATGCDALHPGYGFLAESPELARRCAAEGISFVGPSVESLELFGDKARARNLAVELEVPVLLGSAGAVTLAEAQAFFAELGENESMVIKAIAGGGGRGMRVVHSEASLLNAVSLTRTEAGTAFGNDTVYLEKYLENPRHIEFQVLADTHGNVVHLGERDCSMQRRHQKVLEEAPAPGIDPEVREAMGARCVAACREIGYRGAGTFEFLYEDGRFYFIEMNTRLQVEHPVTELVTGIDIVKAQLRIAAGEDLPFAQGDVHIRGHAVECRINAEHPTTFRPSPGTITMFHPPGGPGIRLDSHIYSGYEVPPYYDSMIGKLIAHGETREFAIARARTALDEIVIEGIDTNIPLHRELCRDAAFLAGGTGIGYLERKLGIAP